MAILISYNKGMLCERVKKHLVGDFAGADFKISDNEILLYVDQSLAYTLVGQVYANAKIEGNIAIPESWLTTFNVGSPSFDSASGYWYCTLPQTPVSLPLGYSLDRVYINQAGSGQSMDFLLIKAKRVGYRRYMPMPKGGRAWVEGVTLWLAASDNSSLSSYTFFARMASTRTSSLSDPLNLPDDAIEPIFQNTIRTIMQRYSIPQDQVLDNLPPGNKSS